MIVLSCGHRIFEMIDSIDAITKADDGMGNKAILHSCVCAYCYVEYRKEGILFDNVEQAHAWLLEK